MSDRAECLARASEIWLDPHHPLRKETVEALVVSTGLHPRQVDLALLNCFTVLSRPSLSAIAAAQKRLSVFHILPANAFTAWVHGAVITLLLGHRCVLKPSTREPVFARAWKRSLEKVSPELAASVEVVAWDEQKLRASDAVVAYGADETLGKIRGLLGPETRFIGYGHKLSVGVLFEEALESSQHEQLVADILRAADPFRLQGCLSPQILYVQVPRNTLRAELEARLDVAPRVIPFEDWLTLAREMRKFEPYLSCVGYAGNAAREESVRQELADCQISRVCPIGLMQQPPLAWQNGGINLVNVLN